MAESEIVKSKERDIEVVVRRAKEQVPEAIVAQVHTKHPADDDSLYFFDLPGGLYALQIESPTPPFLLETNEQSSSLALKANTVDEAVSMITTYLRSALEGKSVHLEGDLYWGEK